LPSASYGPNTGFVRFEVSLILVNSPPKTLRHIPPCERISLVFG
jgi:hypothetical protein